MVKDFFRLIRWYNLLFIIFIQYMMRWFVIKPVLANLGLDFAISEINFALLVLSTVLIAAAGYAINDYYDLERDKAQGRKIVIGKTIKAKSVFIFFAVANLIAIGISIYLSILINFYKLSFIFIIISGLLWFYSQDLKKSFLIGNLIIALLAALVPLIILPYEVLEQYNINSQFLHMIHNNLGDIIFWLIFYSGFAFVLTLIREIIKDIEDYDIDNTFDYRTLPIVLGVKKTKIIVSVLSFLSIILFIFITKKHFIYDFWSIIYVSVLIFYPLMTLGVGILRAKGKKHYMLLSLLTKIIMFTGVLFSFFICKMY